MSNVPGWSATNSVTASPAFGISAFTRNALIAKPWVPSAERRRSRTRSPSAIEMVAGSNWNRDARTSIVLTSTSSPPLTCRAHAPAAVAQIANRKMNAFLFKTVSFESGPLSHNAVRR